MIKGRWKWLGLPKKTALLDRDDYFDAELNDDQQRFMDDCAGSLVGESSLFEKENGECKWQGITDTSSQNEMYSELYHRNISDKQKQPAGK
jgi:hypothetical protein